MYTAEYLICFWTVLDQQFDSDYGIRQYCNSLREHCKGESVVSYL